MRQRLAGVSARDFGLAVLVFALAEGQLAAGELSGPRLVGTLAALLYASAMLAWRRRPWLAVVLVFTTAVASDALGLSQRGPYGTMVAGFVALYGLSSQASLRAALAGLAFGLGMVFWSAHQYGLWDYAFAILLLGGAVLMGRVLRSRRLLIEQLRTTMDDLETTLRQLELSREERAHTAVAEERVRIARELHDVIAHAVSVIVIQAGAAEEMLALDPRRAQHPLQAVQDSARHALSELRHLLAVLRPDAPTPAIRSPQPGLADLELLAAHLAAAGLSVSLHREGTPPGALPAGVDLAAFRIVQEALTNVLKHANTAAARVAIRYDADAVELEIVDDGPAAPRRPPRPGQHGLIGMRERAAAYGGDLEAGFCAEGGYAVRARLLVSGAR
jgi:signal transduction histidine kinase